ncbi:MAG: hypothetical protein JNL82_31915 [Myxococcales bacterium]|nr:hypothetical protein [Myxococcales bacterium]
MAGRSDGASHWDLALRRLLGQFWTRLFLSACIVTSLLPLGWVRELDVAFLAVFGVEFLLRCGLGLLGTGDEAAAEGRRGTRLGSALLLLADLLALVSFLPIVAHDTPWMRLLRVVRLVALLSYWAPALYDLRVVLLRRERSRQVLVMGALVGLLSFIGALVLEQLDVASGANVDYDDDGEVTARDRRFSVHLWWAFRQIQDPGNMLGAPEAVGAVVVSVVLTVFGLFLVSFLIGLGTDVVRELMTVSRMRPPGLRGHTVIVHVNAATRPLLVDLANYYQKLIPEGSLSRRWWRQLAANARQLLLGPRFVVLGHQHEPPTYLRHLPHIVYRHGSPADRDFMARADIPRARRVLVLADMDAQNPDAETIHALLTIHDGLHPRGSAATDRPVLTAMPRRRGLARLKAGRAKASQGRLLVAEILDERNLPAAWAAISYGSGEVRTFVVHVERLIGLYMACVARIGGLVPVLDELLSSAGHELYTCFFAAPALSYQATTPPSLPGRASEAMATLRAAAADRPARRFLVPIGLLAEEGEGEWASQRVHFGGQADEERRWIGFVALAPSFAVVRDFADALQRPAPASAASPASEGPTPPRTERQADLPLKKILVCGFRAATVGLLEALVLAEPAAEILVLVDDEATRAAAVERFGEHRALADYRALTLALGSFAPQADGSFVYQPRVRQDQHCGRVRLAVGDRTSLPQLIDLPHGFGHAGDLDLALVLATRREDSDARTTQTLLALEVVRTHGGRRSRLRVVAEVVDAELCRRLRRRARQVGDELVQVFSLENLRAAFLFQSAVIPGFNLVYGELLGPWGQSFARLVVTTPGQGRCSFAALAERLVARGELLLGVEVTRGGERRVVLGAGEAASIDLAEVVALWVLAGDAADEVRGRCVDGPVA